MPDADVTGLDDLANLVTALKAAGGEGKGLRKELNAGLNRATKPVRADLNASVGPSFPRGGGLAALMERRARFGVSTRATARTTAVRLVARGKGRRTLAQASRFGSISHPVFGNRKVWIKQTAGVESGKPQEAFEKDKPVVKREVLQAIADVRNKIYRSV